MDNLSSTYTEPADKALNIKPRKKIVHFLLMAAACFMAVTGILLYFNAFHGEDIVSGGRSGKGAYILELTPDQMDVGDYAIYECYRATVKNGKGTTVSSGKTLHVMFNGEEKPYGYGRWEISRFKFKHKFVKEESSFFIFSSATMHYRLVLSVDIVRELPSDDFGIKILNPIEELQLGKEHQFEFTCYPDTELSWSAISDRDDGEPVVEVDNNGHIKAVNYGEATIDVFSPTNHNQSVRFPVIVPYYAESIQLTTSYNTNEIYLDEYRTGLYITYYPSYSTNQNYTVTMSNPILEFDKDRSDWRSIYFIPKATGSTIVTVTTDNNVNASIELKVLPPYKE